VDTHTVPLAGTRRLATSPKRKARRLELDVDAGGAEGRGELVSYQAGTPAVSEEYAHRSSLDAVCASVVWNLFHGNTGPTVSARGFLDDMLRRGDSRTDQMCCAWQEVPAGARGALHTAGT